MQKHACCTTKEQEDVSSEPSFASKNLKNMKWKSDLQQALVILDVFFQKLREAACLVEDVAYGKLVAWCPLLHLQCREAVDDLVSMPAKKNIQKGDLRNKMVTCAPPSSWRAPCPCRTQISSKLWMGHPAHWTTAHLDGEPHQPLWVLAGKTSWRSPSCPWNVRGCCASAACASSP